MIDRDHQQLSLVRQCILLDVSRASVYPAGTDQGRRPGVDGPDPSVFEDPLLRLQEDEGLAAATGLSGEPKKGSKADAGSHLPASQHQQTSAGIPDLSLSARLIGSTRSGPRTSPTSPWRRASCTWWPSWTGTAGTSLEALQHHGHQLGSPWDTGDIQHRPGESVHQ